jgi:hypothetical protein
MQRSRQVHYDADDPRPRPADAGVVTVNGKPFAGLSSAMREVSALPDSTAALGLRDPPQ